MKYILNTEAMRIVEKNDKGTVTYRKRYRKGDEVDVSKMEESRVDLLVEQGTLVTSEDDLSEPVEAGSLQPHSGPFGAGTEGQSGPTAAEVEAQQEAEEESDPDSGSVAANTLIPSNPEAHIEPPAPTGDGGEDEVEDVDQFSEMGYSDLQDAAKDRNLKYVGVSADDLRTNLREFEAAFAENHNS